MALEARGESYIKVELLLFLDAVDNSHCLEEAEAHNALKRRVDISHHCTADTKTLILLKAEKTKY